MTTEQPSLKPKCRLCGKELTWLENDQAIDELNRIISERTNGQLKASENRNLEELKRQSEIYKDQLQEKERVHNEEIQKKDRTLQEINRQLEELKDTAVKNAREEVKDELEAAWEIIKQKEIQLERAKEDASKLKLKLTAKQSELKGEVGELSLENILQIFTKKGDIITHKKRRGENTAEIIHQIMGPNRQLLDTVIVYDNKNVQRVQKYDVDKSRSYKEIHNTDYSIIVAKNIPKEYSANGQYAEKDGVLIIDPELLIPVVENIRRGLIEIAKISNNKQGKLTKQSKLYNYITGQDFCRQLEALHTVYNGLINLQEDEEKRHKTLWKKRTQVYNELKEHYTNIYSGLDAILQEGPIVDLVNGDIPSP